MQGGSKRISATFAKYLLVLNNSYLQYSLTSQIRPSSHEAGNLFKTAVENCPNIKPKIFRSYFSIPFVKLTLTVQLLGMGQLESQKQHQNQSCIYIDFCSNLTPTRF